MLSQINLIWLIRRLRRIYLVEIPYRIISILRTQALKRGWFDATRIPAYGANFQFGKPWVRTPIINQANTDLIIQEADFLLLKGVEIFNIIVPFVYGSPNWNRDPVTNIDIPINFGLHIDFRHLSGDVDVKYIWELNRHLWLVTLAQAYAVSGQSKYLDALSQHIDSWLSQCPYSLGPNWSSPVEHGIRLINWSIIWHLIGGVDSRIFSGLNGNALLNRWLASIYQHVSFIDDNYSFYSSADNHLIGEAAGVFIAGHTWDLWSKGRAMRLRAKDILEEEILKQFSVEGVNQEQAFCYHKFSLEFLVASMICGSASNDEFSRAYKLRVQSSMEFAAVIMDCDGKVPHIGDSDDGKVFRFVGDGSVTPYESLLRLGSILFNSPILIRKLKLLNNSLCKKFSWFVIHDRFEIQQSVGVTPALSDSSKYKDYVVFGRDLHMPNELRMILNVGPLGYNKIAGHGHADALSLLLSSGGENFLIDPGTYCYNTEPEFRHYFRSTAAHNTVTIDGMDQSVYGGSFLWLRDVETTTHSFSDDGDTVIVEASHDGYIRLDDPLRHFRKIIFNRKTLDLLVEDRFYCETPHGCSVHWHFSPECEIKYDGVKYLAVRDAGILEVQIISSKFQVSTAQGKEMPLLGWVSPQFYERDSTLVLVAEGIVDKSSLIKTYFKFTPSISDSVIDTDVV
jgi:hypothetical protein